MDNVEYHILVAEDELQLLQSIHFMLKRRGYTVFTASSGNEALAILTAHHNEGRPIDLLITDMHMPGLNGEQLIQSVRMIDSSLRILVITAFGQKDVAVRLMRLGCRDLLDKPFGLSDLESRVDALLDDKHFDAMARKRKEQLMFIGDEARSLVHDLNNMMCTTLSYSDLALREMNADHPARKRIEKILASTQVASAISRKLIGMRAERVRPLRVPTQMQAVVRNITTVMSGIAPDTVRVHAQAPEEPLWLNVDAERTYQALFNLGMNSLDAMPGGGTLTVKLSVESSVPDVRRISAPWVCLTVSDTGHGMSQTTVDKLFQQRSSTKEKGHGIGLSTVKTIVEDHNGWINVQSLPGKGTDFRLFFPFSQGEGQIADELSRN